MVENWCCMEKTDADQIVSIVINICTRAIDFYCCKIQSEDNNNNKNIL